MIKHYVEDGKSQELYDCCTEYRELFEKYKREKGVNDYEYDEALVDYNRIKSVYDIAFFITLSGLPECFISTINLNTMGFVMKRYSNGDSAYSILKEADKRRGEPPKEKEDSDEKESEEQEQEETEVNNEDKNERFAFAVGVVKDSVAKGSQSKSFELKDIETGKTIVVKSGEGAVVHSDGSVEYSNQEVER